jgi:hypothetical protein
VAHGAGGSRPFLVVASDLAQYWLKPPNNPQGPMVPVNEQIVGRLGRWLGVSVCDCALVEIPAALAGTEIAPSYVLVECVAHGSLAVSGAIEQVPQLLHRGEDENALRHAGFVALHDWLWGGDDQWLRAAGDSNRYYSHDHGHYFPQGPNWTPASLSAHRDAAHPSTQPIDNLNPNELMRIASRLDTVAQEEIAAMLQNIPASWPFDAAAKAAVVDFAVHRAPGVADRLRQLAAV